MSNIISKKIQEARSKPIGIVATKVSKANFLDKLETFGTAIANRSYSIRIKKNELIKLIDLNNYKNIFYKVFEHFVCKSEGTPTFF